MEKHLRKSQREDLNLYKSVILVAVIMSQPRQRVYHCTTSTKRVSSPALTRYSFAGEDVKHTIRYFTENIILLAVLNVNDVVTAMVNPGFEPVLKNCSYFKNTRRQTCAAMYN